MSDSVVNKAPGEPPELLTRSAPHTARRTLGRVLGVLVIALVCAFLADSVAAIRAEHSLARSLQAAPKVEFEPEVTLSGFPFITHARSGSFAGAVIAARGVAVDGCHHNGGCRANLGATLTDLRSDSGWQFAPDSVLATSSVTATTQVDSVNLGRLLDITDLSVNTPAPDGKAGAGGPGDGLLERERGVVLTGTVAVPPTAATGDMPSPLTSPSASAYPGETLRVSVNVALDVVDGRLRITAYELYTGPQEHADPGDLQEPHNRELLTAVLARFSTTLPRLPAPWNIAPTRAHSAGSDVVLVGETGPRELKAIDF